MYKVDLMTYNNLILHIFTNSTIIIFGHENDIDFLIDAYCFLYFLILHWIMTRAGYSTIKFESVY